MAISVPPSSGDDRLRRSAHGRKRRPLVEPGGRAAATPASQDGSRTSAPAHQSIQSRLRGRRSRSSTLFRAGDRTQPRQTAVRRPLIRKLPPALSAAAAHKLHVRIWIVWGVLTFSALVLIGNLFRLQIVQASWLQQQAIEQRVVKVRPLLPRRTIVDQQGNALAVDRMVYTLYAHPVMFKQPKPEVAAFLAPILNRSAADLTTLFNRQDTGIEVEYTISEDMADRIQRQSVDGLELVQRQQRLYPQQDSAAEVVGYIDVDRKPQLGVEYSQDRLLERSTQVARFLRAGNDTLTPGLIPDTMLQQDDLELKLTIDSRLQRVARTALKQKMQEYNAKRGAVIVMNVQDGALLSLTTEPTYDPNRYFSYGLENLRNWALTDPYEPGSTFKPINVAIALETGAISPNDIFNDEGSITIGEWTIENNDYAQNGARGAQSVADIIKYSSNVGMVRIMQRLKRDVFYDWLAKIGLSQPVGIDLPTEIAGQVKSRDQFLADPIEAATAAFGQGFTLTPIQLAQLHSTLANGGTLVKPHVVQGLYDHLEQPHWQPEQPELPRLFSQKTAQAVLGMMEGVVEGGTGKIAQIPGYRIAGKTGTAQKASTSGGYSNARITSFVGIFPAERPRYTILVVVDEPQGDDAYGSTVAAPIARAVMETLITVEQIPPSKPIEQPVESTEP